MIAIENKGKIRILSNKEIGLISGFHREVGENCALLSHYTASSCNSLPTCRDEMYLFREPANVGFYC
jgi:hypothetical protein